MLPQTNGGSSKSWLAKCVAWMMLELNWMDIQWRVNMDASPKMDGENDGKPS